jgi:hypothetical protein
VRNLAVVAMLGAGSGGCARIFGLDDPALVAPSDAGQLDGDAWDAMELDALFFDVGLPACPPGFNSLAGSAHLYKLITVAADWNVQQTGCKALSSAAYLAIPDDASELLALDTLAAGATYYWIGIGDSTNEGTYMTVKGAAATFLPWAAGEPDNSAPGTGEDCIDVQPSTHTIFDDRCLAIRIAICECEP